MELIPNATQVLLYSYSSRAQAAALALVAGYQVMPDSLREALPAPIVMMVASVVLVLGIVGRLITQPDLVPKPENKP